MYIGVCVCVRTYMFRIISLPLFVQSGTHLYVFVYVLTLSRTTQMNAQPESVWLSVCMYACMHACMPHVVDMHHTDHETF